MPATLDERPTRTLSRRGPARALKLVILLLAGALGWAAEAFDPFQGPRPLVVVQVTDPWIMVVGSDTPIFALYEDGQVIQEVKGAGGDASYQWKQLTKPELEQLLRRVAACGPYPEKARHVELSRATDMPETRIYVDLGGTPYARSVYGLRWGGGEVLARDPAVELPVEVGRLGGLLWHLSMPGMRPWVPRYVEVMAWPYEYAPRPSLPWPQTWPGLSSSRAFKRGDSWSIFLDGTAWPQVNAFLRKLEAKAAVEIEGRKWALAVRGVFPNEKVWRAAFRKAEAP